jgi:hypothetical protein
LLLWRRIAAALLLVSRLLLWRRIAAALLLVSRLLLWLRVAAALLLVRRLLLWRRIIKGVRVGGQGSAAATTISSVQDPNVPDI